MYRYLSSVDDGPDSVISIEIGAIGIVLFTFLFILSSYAYYSAINKYSKKMFICAMIFSFLELPRYIALVVQGSYTNQITYAIHLLASVFFFASFSYACYLLHDAVDLSKVSSPLRESELRKKQYFIYFILNKKSLIGANIAFAILTILVGIQCILASNLEYFFHNNEYYKVFTYVDIAKNFLYGGSFLFYSIAVRMKIRTMILDIDSDSESEITVRDNYILKKLQRSMTRLMWLMIVCLVSFVIRSMMLLIKAVVVEDSVNSPISSWMPPYGILWWTLSDFIPRSLPIASFFYFLGRPRSRESIVRDDPRDDDNDCLLDRDDFISRDGLTTPLTISDVYIDQHQNEDFEEDEPTSCIPIPHHPHHHPIKQSQQSLANTPSSYGSGNWRKQSIESMISSASSIIHSTGNDGKGKGRRRSVDT
mmetsp:Transcript_7928/g.11847  ORF Transcript_7928/g.11847 Transcript_7928/m.11847 type:complete len:422 (+) Transcript_7928:52-1317(+)